MSNTKTDFHKETELQIWWNEVKKKYGKNVISKIIGCGKYQLGYEYAKEIVVYLDDKEVAKYDFPVPEDIEYE